MTRVLAVTVEVVTDVGHSELTRRQALAAAGTAAAGAAALGAGVAAARPAGGSDVQDDGNGLIVAGNVRLTVITPRLVRYEYSAWRRFENRTTMLAHNRAARSGEYRVTRSGGTLTLETAALTLTCPVGSFDPTAPQVTLKHSGARVRPAWQPDRYVPAVSGMVFLVNAFESWPAQVPPLPPGNLGGWLRCLDGVRDTVNLQPGLLSTHGWFFIDDSQSALIGDGATPARRAADSQYRDGYLFAYGRDYRQALADLRTLSGAAPMLPRQAFGNWFSRYAPYPDDYYRTSLLPTYRANGASLDVLVVDTDFKSPNTWNGWNWNQRLFPNPARFFRWAHDRDLAVALNIHPSISGDDVQFPLAQRRSGGVLKAALTPASRFFSALGKNVKGALGPTFVWDLTDRRQVDSFMRAHDPLEKQGVDLWWLDWIIDEAYSGIPPEELAADVWIARAYGRRPRMRQTRWPLLARNGASYWDMVGTRPGPWGGHRYTIHFTGDTYATWGTLAMEVKFTHAEGNIGMPYVSHDIGGFKGETDPERYVRWMQFGAFSPIMRIHSQNLQTRRLPWEFTAPYRQAAAEMLRVRSALVPYLYTAGRIAHETGLPMARGMYLHWPHAPHAYSAEHQYLLGEDLLVAPVVKPDGAVQVWFPEGTWVNCFTGIRVTGPTVKRMRMGLSDVPVYARAGATVPVRAGVSPAAATAAPIALRVHAGADGVSRHYHDDGHSHEHRDGAYSWTTMSWNDTDRSLTTAVESPAGFGAPAITRVDLVGLGGAPTGVIVDGRPVPDKDWSYDPRSRTASADVVVHPGQTQAGGSDVRA